MFADAAPVIEAVLVQVEPDVHLRLVESPPGLFVDHAVQTVGTEEILPCRVYPDVVLRQRERPSYYRIQSLSDSYILEPVRRAAPGLFRILRGYDAVDVFMRKNFTT